MCSANLLEDRGSWTKIEVVRVVQNQRYSKGFSLLCCEAFDGGLSCDGHEGWEHGWTIYRHRLYVVLGTVEEYSRAKIILETRARVVLHLARTSNCILGEEQEAICRSAKARKARLLPVRCFVDPFSAQHQGQDYAEALYDGIMQQSQLRRLCTMCSKVEGSSRSAQSALSPITLVSVHTTNMSRRSGAKLNGIFQSKEKIAFYLGIDPSGPTLHAGHLLPLIVMLHFQLRGHRPFLLVRDFASLSSTHSYSFLLRLAVQPDWSATRASAPPIATTCQSRPYKETFGASSTVYINSRAWPCNAFPKLPLGPSAMVSNRWRW